MRITQVDLEGIGAWPHMQATDLAAGLNLLHAAPNRGKSTLARLIGQLLYGKSADHWQPSPNGLKVLPNGSLTIDHQFGRSTLKRERDNEGHALLSMANLEGQAIDRQDILSRLGGMSSEDASQLLAVDFLAAPQPENLLREPFLSSFGSKLEVEIAENSTSETLDRERIEQLVNRRNAVARQLQESLGASRRDSDILDGDAKQVDGELQQRRATVESLKSRLSEVEAQLAELNAFLRHLSLQSNSVPMNLHDEQQLQHQLEQLDQEISRCRQTIDDLQARQTTLQTELAKLKPDGSADRITSLADSRFTLSVVERLLEDLDAEVAQLARADQSARPVGEDAHARFSPLADLLRKQLYCLCGQLAEQERAASREQLQAEVRQLRKAQTELGDRLEQLLGQRESVIGRAKAATRATVHTPTLPTIDQCHCTGHQAYVSSPERRAEWQNEEAAKQQRSRLENQRYQLLNEIAELGREITQLESTWKHLQEERAGMVEGTSIEAKRAELDRLELLLKQALNVRVFDPVQEGTGRWQASDVLAQLSDGKLTQVRLSREEPSLQVLDNRGQRLSLSELSAAQRDQLYVALTMALVSNFAARGYSLPLVLDEPFLRQDAEATAIMAGVLEEFGRAGHQTLVFTENLDALRTLRNLGTRIIDFQGPKRTLKLSKPAPTVTTTKTTRLVRETFDGQQSPGLRLASGHGEGDIEAVFYLSENSSLSEFPVLGKDTSQIFARLSLHTVADLLDANPRIIAERLNRPGIDENTVSLWQSHMLLLCKVPELTLNDAQLLTACGIMSPHDLRHARTEDLWSAISSFLESDSSGRFATVKSRYSRQRTDDWIYAAGGVRERSSRRTTTRRTSKRRPSPGTGTRRRVTKRRTSTRTGSRRKRSPVRVSPAEQSNSASSSSLLKFHLSRESDVEAAPSIGPKTAERLLKVGIRTVADLLNADPQATAEMLETRHIRAKTITQWQDQARLVCQIPDLHGYGAMLLVACGLTEPERIAGSNAAELIVQIQEFCETKQGQRILRAGEAPTAKRIQRWIELAQHSRPLEVA